MRSCSFFVNSVFLITFGLMFSGCFDSKGRLERPPNLALETYIAENTEFCGIVFSKSAVLKSVTAIEDQHNRKAEYFLRMGFCYAMSGEEELSKLYMMRTIHYSDLVKTDGRANQIALSYLAYGSDEYSTDFGWANQKMLHDNITRYGYGGFSKELSRIRNQNNLKLFLDENIKMETK